MGNLEKPLSSISKLPMTTTRPMKPSGVRGESQCEYCDEIADIEETSLHTARLTSRLAI